MAIYRVLYNPLSDSGSGKERAQELNTKLKNDTLTFTDVRSIGDFPAFFGTLAPGEIPVLCGGDGTLNCFVNALPDGYLSSLPPLYYYAAGSGNDFLNDIGGKQGDAPVLLNPYLEHLPRVSVDGAPERLFINGIGFGIDGYCCEEGDRQRAAGAKKINYTAIALKGLFGAYSPRRVHILADGAEYTFENVWLAPVMHGRYFGGGMMPAPRQERLGEDRLLTLLVFSEKSRIRTLVRFPALFNGSCESTRGCTHLTARDITVEYEDPTPLQIDGETVPGVRRCRCRSSALTD